MQEMSKMFGGMNAGMFGEFENKEILILNSGNPLVQKLAAVNDSENPDTTMICEHLYDLAVMSHRPLSAEDMNKFVTRSCVLMEKLAGRD